MATKLFKKGVAPNPKGRPVGLKDRRWDLKQLMETMERMDYDPFETQIAIAKHSEDDYLKERATSKIMDKLIASKKYIEKATDDYANEMMKKITETMVELEEKNKKDY